jgi:hypothetical protein
LACGAAGPAGMLAAFARGRPSQCCGPG